MFRSRAPGPSIVLDPTLAWPDARAAVAAAARDDRAAVEQILRNISDLSHLDFVLKLVTDGTTECPRWLAQWVGDDPGDLLARTALGVFHVNRAWVHRSRKRAKDVSRQQFEGFFTALRDAEPLLRDAVREEPRNGPAWRALIDASRGLQLSFDEKRDLARRCLESNPLFLPACRSHLQSTCPKWSGSVEEALGFARWVVASCPPGHPALSLVAEAHYELADVTDSGIRRIDAVNEVRAALARSGLSQRSAVDDPLTLLGRNMFAAAAHVLDDRDTARHMFGLIGLDGSRVTERPWSDWGDSAAAFVRAGRRSGAW